MVLCSPRMCSSAETSVPFGMAALQRLPQLLRIAQQHEAFRGLGDRQHVGERELPGLVDEQHVHGLEKLLARPQPGRSGGDLRRARLERAEGRPVAPLPR